MEKRDDCKKTKIGWIPEDWNVVKFGDIVDLGKSKANPKDNERCQCIELEHIEQKTGRLLGYAPANGKNSSKTFFKRGDILFGKLRPYLMKYCHPDFNGVCSTEIFVFSPKDKADNKFVFNIVQSDGFIANAVSKSFGTKMPRTNWKIVKEYLFPLPPLPEQQKIADFLTTVDDKITSIEDQIQQTQQLKKGLMEKLLTEGIGHTKFKDTKIGRIPRCWNIGRLEDCSEIILGQSPPGSSYNTNGLGIPMLNGPTEFTIKSPIPVQYTTSPTKLCKNQDILFCVRGSSTGRMNIADQEYCIGRGLAAIRQRGNSNTKFIFYILVKIANKILLEAKGAGSTFPNVSGKELSDKVVAIPPLSEQKQIASILSAVDDKLDILQSKKSRYETLKKGLMQQLLTGERRVKL